MSPVDRPHVLYVAWGFPPCRGSGVYRALATANAFATAGFDVTVLTAEREIFLRYTGADPSLEALVDPAVHVERVPFAWPSLDPDIAGWSPLRAYAPRLWVRLRKRRDVRPFPEPAYGPWRPVLEAAAERIHSRRPVDLVVATANPHVTFSAARHLHQRHSVPYVMDYRDAWSLDVFSGERVHPDRSRVGRWERQLVEGAREVWFVNDAIRDWHRQAYPQAADRMHTVANGYDPQFVHEGGGHRPRSDEPLVFGYLGTAARQVPLAEFVAGWRQAREDSPLLAGATAELHGHLGHYRQPAPALLSLLAEAEPDGVSYRGPVAKVDVAGVYDRFDALLLILGTGRYVTSGKVFEYLATGLPIVSVHDPGNAASDVLRGYPLWFPAASLAAEDVATALRRAAGAARTATPEQRAAALAYARSYRRDAQLGPRVTALAATTLPVPSAGADA